MPNISEVPVLIVGGGAAGCVLSMELARRGVEYRCIDRMPGPGRETRAIAMHARTVELLDLVDKELSRRILDATFGARDMSCTSSATASGRRCVPAWITQPWIRGTTAFSRIARARPKRLSATIRAPGSARPLNTTQRFRI